MGVHEKRRTLGNRAWIMPAFGVLVASSVLLLLLLPQLGIFLSASGFTWTFGFFWTFVILGVGWLFWPRR